MTRNAACAATASTSARQSAASPSSAPMPSRRTPASAATLGRGQPPVVVALPARRRASARTGPGRRSPGSARRPRARPATSRWYVSSDQVCVSIDSDGTCGAQPLDDLDQVVLGDLDAVLAGHQQQVPEAPAGQQRAPPVHLVRRSACGGRSAGPWRTRSTCSDDRQALETYSGAKSRTARPNRRSVVSRRGLRRAPPAARRRAGDSSAPRSARSRCSAARARSTSASVYARVDRPATSSVSRWRANRPSGRPSGGHAPTRRRAPAAGRRAQAAEEAGQRRGRLGRGGARDRAPAGQEAEPAGLGGQRERPRPSRPGPRPPRSPC